MRCKHIQRDWEQVRDEVLGDRAAFGWLATALRSALGHEPHRVANDVELLVGILRGRCQELEDEAGEGAPRGSHS